MDDPQSWALDDRAAFLTPIPRATLFCRCQLFEFVTLAAARLETFWAKAVSQLLRRQGQMAIPAPDRGLPFWQQFEGTVMAGTHV